MATETDRDSSVVSEISRGLRRVVRGRDDTRVRAVWRVLLASVVILQLQELAAVRIVQGVGLGGAFLGVAQAAAFGVLLLGWARYIDRRPLSDYGFAASGTWVLDGVVGFVAASVGFGVWLSLGSAAGWADVAVALTAPEGSLLIGLGIAFVGQALNIWVQETIFMGMVLKSAAEGLAQRGVTASRAVVSAWVVAVSLFTVAHGPVTLGRAVSLGLGLGVFGLLYVQTGDLALPIGVHAGMNYVGGVLVVSPSAAAQRVSLVEVTTSLSGVLGSLNSGAVPQAVIAYLVVLGWLRLRHRPWSIRLGLTAWTER